MVGFSEYDAAYLHTVIRLYPQIADPFRRLAMLIAVPVAERISRIVEFLHVDIGSYRIVIGMAPAELAIMPRTDVWRTENGKSRNVESLIGTQVCFVALASAEESDVRIDQQHRVAGSGAGGRYGPHVRSFVEVLHRLRRSRAAGKHRKSCRPFRRSKARARRMAHFSGQNPPGLPPCQQPGMSLGVRLQVAIHTRREAVAQGAQLRVGLFVCFPGALLDLVRPIEQ